MPVDVFEEVLPLEIDVLEAVPLSPDSPEAWKSAYPYPWLRRTGQRQTIDFRTVVIENEYLRVTVVPDLGGRILRLLDKRTGTEILGDPKSLSVEEGSDRGVWMRQGIQWTLNGDLQPNSLGPVEFQYAEPDDENCPAGIWLATLAGEGLSAHIGILLAPGSAAVHLELKVFNRSLRHWPFDPHIATSFSGDRVANAHYNTEVDAGLDLDGPFLPAWAPIHVVSAPDGSRPLGLDTFADWSNQFPLGRDTGPRQLRTLSMRLTPLSGLGGLTASNADIAFHIVGALLKFQVTAPKVGAKVLLRTADGQTLEAQADLYPETVLAMELGNVSSNLAGIVVLDSERRELIRWQLKAEPQLLKPEFDKGIDLLTRGEDPTKLLANAEVQIGTRAASITARGIYAMRQGRFAEAEQLFEDSLLYNAEDHLTWWAKAVAARRAGADPSEERPELLNAHFLAPLEPVLRAESFLASAVDSSAVITPMLDNPDALIEVGCLLHDMGLFEDLSKWTHEVLKKREVPMLRYLLADALLAKSRMQAEAAQHVVAAGKTPINPPYPIRETEIRVMRRLLDTFPKDARLNDLIRLFEWYASHEQDES